MTAPMICPTLVSIVLLPGLMHLSSMTWDMVLIRSAPLHLMKMHSRHQIIGLKVEHQCPHPENKVRSLVPKKTNRIKMGRSVMNHIMLTNWYRM